MEEKPTLIDYELLGRAFCSFDHKSVEEQDARGWNKLFNVVWTKYLQGEPGVEK